MKGNKGLTSRLQSIYFVYMNTAVINIRTDLGLKSAAQKVAEELGFSISSLVNAYLKQLVKTKTVHFSEAEEPSDYLIQLMKEAEADRRAGRYHSFNNSTEALEYLDKIIGKGKKRRGN